MPDSVQTIIGAKISETRASKGLSKAKFGELLGVSGQLLGKYEAGKIEPKTEFRRKFMELFGVDILNIENNVSTETKPQDSPQPSHNTNQTEADMIKAAMELARINAETARLNAETSLKNADTANILAIAHDKAIDAIRNAFAREGAEGKTGTWSK